MDELISEKEILKLGFKKECTNSYALGKRRYLKCPSCHKWNESRAEYDVLKKITDICFWCKNKFEIKATCLK